MITIQGMGVSAGIGMGPLHFYTRAATTAESHTAEDANEQWRRFKDAQADAMAQLDALAEKARREVGNDAALLFETHRMMAGDMDYEEAVKEMIREGKLCAESAVSCAGEQFAQMFESMDDSYMRARAADVKDVSRRILTILCGGKPGGAVHSGVPVLLAADDLAPSETLQMDKTKIIGFITAQGFAVSHTAILARAMGIPAVVGVGEQLRPEYEGRQAIVDGGAGVVIIDPNEETRACMMKEQEKQRAYQRTLTALKGKENVTLDGQRVRVCCNIGAVEDGQSVLENDGEGIGLFRSEFLYLGAKDYPSEQEQFEAYRTVLSAMEEREVIVRTCDVGADKSIGYFGLPAEENPAMGMRALRISLSCPDVFRTQLRALCRASIYGNLSIMFPMVTSVWEIREAKALVEQVKAELREEGLPCSDSIGIGAMIETPAAALISDRLSKEVDFFSCGTNDLTQYTLACDRQNGSLNRFYDPHHLAVLRLMKMVADNAHKSGIWVGVCGELAADEQILETLLAIGVDELSVSPGEVLPLRNAIRRADMSGKRERILGELNGEEN